MPWIGADVIDNLLMLYMWQMVATEADGVASELSKVADVIAMVAGRMAA